MRYAFHDNGQAWVGAWHSPNLPAPDGKPHGSAAVGLTPERQVLLVSQDAESWQFPGGRPEPGEDWRATLERELLEEACVQVQDAKLLGYFRGECVEGPELGLVLVRSLWRADVLVLPWNPQHEITHRLLVPSDGVLALLDFDCGMMRVHERWLNAALAI